MTLTEQSRAFWDARPCNIRHSDKPVGTKEYFDEVEKRKYFVEPHIPAFAEFWKWRDKKVLEIGCGIGTDAVNFIRSGAHYTGIDLSGESAELAVKRFMAYGLLGTVYQGNAENLTIVIPPRTFDLVYSFGVIHHCENPHLVIENVTKYMGPESEFRLMLYSHDSWKGVMLRAGFDQFEAQAGCPTADTYTMPQVHHLMERHGLEVFEWSRAHIFPYNVAKYRNYEYELEPWFKAMPKDMFKALEKQLGWHLLIKCRLTQ
jgi:SAM-dependent methyltransferase